MLGQKFNESLLKPVLPSSLALLIRSMPQITAELSAYVHIPAEHVQENRASPGVYDEAEGEKKGQERIQTRSGAKAPDDAFVSVQYRDHWFYIENRDFLSKRLFSFLMFVYTLVESGSAENAPAITIPTG